MLGLPKVTEINKLLPKKAIYAKFQMNTAAKERFDGDISRLTIVNEISHAKINVVEGETVKSVFVVLVSLKRVDYDEKNIIAISKLIPQNILFVLECDGKAKLAIYHMNLMQSPWKPVSDLSIELKGLNMDKVWENIIVQVGGIVVQENRTLDEQIDCDTRKAEINKEIARLEKKARSEIQPKKKFEIVQKINELKNKLGG